MAGNAAAFGAFVKQHDHELRGGVWAVVRSTHATDDVMQASYEKAFRSIDTFDGRSSLTTWLHTICHRTALDHLRYEGRRRHDDVDDLRREAGDASTERSAIARSEIMAAFDGLDPIDRVLLTLVAALGLSFDEASTITGLRRGTVSSRVSRARARIRRWEDR